MSINEQLKKNAGEIETLLGSYIPESDKPYGVIHEAMRYSLLSGGKRLRPFLVIEFARLAASAAGKDPDEAQRAAGPYACALEMIHTYSLIHDDLPCMDDDVLRRGMPTNHVKFGEANALLAGDGLLTRAFGVAVTNPNADAATNCRAAALLSDCAGADGMIGGQVLDLIGETESFGIETLELLQSLKTGELIRAAALLGCYAGGASDEMIRAAERYAMGIGRAFQVIDDILDVVGDEATFGKPIGSDKESGKTTFATCMTIEQAREYARTLTDDAKAAISHFAGSETLCELAQYLLTRDK